MLTAMALASARPIAAQPSPPAAAPSVGDPQTPPRSLSGVYPRLAMFNNEGECGTGAVVPWADRLWAITYGPHLPFGSSDKLYEITPDLRQIVRDESVGGTHANRMVHRESQQLVIGPYLIDAQRRVRVIPPAKMPGRLTGAARHLVDPANKVYFATMEEGLYEVDVRSLDVVGLIRDGNAARPGQTAETHPATIASQLPGYHGKGLYTSQGRLIYANNGDRHPRVTVDPTIPSGALAEWRGSGDWSLVRRNQFTEVTGPGGVRGAANPDTDPVWSVGWDARSLILMLLDAGQWRAYRLPKASHCYDGAHGWNTEWPRIRDVGDRDLLMTMHGTLWRFPSTFRRQASAGLAPRSTHLKVIGDFCRWGDRVVFGCDDTAKSEFLNKRKAKGAIAGPGQSQSNLWFVAPDQLDKFGPPLGRGAVWLDDPVAADTPSEPFLFSGYEHRSAFLSHDQSQPVVFTVEVDAQGDDAWRTLRTVNVPPAGAWIEFPPHETGAWIRLRLDRACGKTTAFFHYRDVDRRPVEPDAKFAGLATPADRTVSGGLIYARGANLRTLRFAAQRVTDAADGAGSPRDLGCYDLDANLNLRRVDDVEGQAWARKNFAIPSDVLVVDDASAVLVEGERRWRFPKGDAAFQQPGPFGAERICREVCTERDLFHCQGTFYELPAENAGGFAKIRPIATHHRRIHDYASYRGMLVLSGVADGAAEAPAEGAADTAARQNNPHIVRSDDGQCALWLGVVDDLWKLGKPRGVGGPWNRTTVEPDRPSDPYLMTGYDRKRVALSHDAPQPVTIRLEVDVSGAGHWTTYREFTVAPGAVEEHAFPAAFSAYWVRATANRACRATVTLTYE